MVGYASSPICIVHADMTLIRCKVNVTQPWPSAPFRGLLYSSFARLLHSLVISCRIARATYVDAAYCYRPSVVCRSVGRSVTLVSPAKTAEPIEMLFGLRTRVGQGNHVLFR